MFERIMVPMDGSRYSARALPYAIEIASKFNAEIILLRVVHRVRPVTPVGPSGTGIMSDYTNQIFVESAIDEEKQHLAEGKRYLQRQLKHITQNNLKGSYRVLVGDPAEEIIDLCKKESINLVVMTTTGKSGVKRAFLGSVADRVIREPGFPVLVIRSET